MNKITVPKRGMGTTPFTIVEWKAGEGEKVEKGSAVVVIESEKVTHEVEAGISGYMHILSEEGSEAPIGTVIAFIAETKKELEALQKEYQKPPAAATAAAATKAGQIEKAVSQKTDESAAKVSGQEKGERLRITPVARRLAKEHNLDISSIKGTGPGGSIAKKDIEEAIKEKTGAAEDKDIYQGKSIKAVVPLTGMKKRIAENLKSSLSISAQLTVMGEIDMSGMTVIRETLLQKEKSIGSRITYTDLFVFLTAKILKNHALLNASLIDNEIKIWGNINIGIATAIDDGLIVPVVKDADKKTLPEISQEIKNLVTRAKQGKLSYDDVTGGTFTITNLGAVGAGYRFETVIINQPESAILGTGGITKRAVVRDDKIVIRPIMTYYLTYDHRVMNGADAANFINGLADAFENPKTFFS
jgi:pyruvate dehydrogenase E2 component (dihydrolipoamide acetyltransferase)/2-oxoglutarate dehydrogenase E2 component (dihydrolipoamide succinyltransferase)